MSLAYVHTTPNRIGRKSILPECLMYIAAVYICVWECVCVYVCIICVYLAKETRKNVVVVFVVVVAGQRRVLPAASGKPRDGRNLNKNTVNNNRIMRARRQPVRPYCVHCPWNVYFEYKPIIHIIFRIWIYIYIIMYNNNNKRQV